MKATNTWGDGPDIILSLEGSKMILLEPPEMGEFTEGTISKGNTDMTCAEAKTLAYELLSIVDHIEQMLKELASLEPTEEVVQ